VFRRARREQEILNRPDPRDPLVINTRELGRRPGSMRQVSRTVQAPAELGNDVLGVPEGTDIAIELRLESVLEGVLVSGTARARAAGECVRCLEPIEQELDVGLQELYFYPESGIEDDEEEVSRLEAELIRLEPVLRDAVVLALPLQPVCQIDCPGLCSECGARLADDPMHHHDVVDPRWAALQGLSTGTTENVPADQTQEI
jgi:uncharacterized protein